jgi:hypothetical protein
MPDLSTAIDYPDIAKTIIEQLGAQIDLVTTLGTAISGGLVALVVQIAIHNRSDGATPLELRALWLVPVALGIETLSLLSGWIARGAITTLTPVLMQLPAENWHGSATGTQTDLLFGEMDFAGATELASYVATQFIAMLVGLVIIFVFASLNIGRLLR